MGFLELGLDKGLGLDGLSIFFPDIEFPVGLGNGIGNQVIDLWI